MGGQISTERSGQIENQLYRRMRVPSPPGLRILCVDHRGQVRGRLIRLFSRAGHRPIGVKDGEVAWARLAKNLNGFEVVVTEHLMPRLNGLQLVERLRNAHYPGRIFVLGASISPEAANAFGCLAVDAILRKGVGESELMRLLTAFHTARWAAPSG